MRPIFKSMQTEAINFDNTEVAFAHKTNAELKGSHFVYSTMSFPWMVKLGTTLTLLALKIKFPIKGMIKKTLFTEDIRMI